jgi:hypothetical protein
MLTASRFCHLQAKGADVPSALSHLSSTSYVLPASAAHGSIRLFARWHLFDWHLFGYADACACVVCRRMRMRCSACVCIRHLFDWHLFGYADACACVVCRRMRMRCSACVCIRHLFDFFPQLRPTSLSAKWVCFDACMLRVDV